MLEGEDIEVRGEADEQDELHEWYRERVQFERYEKRRSQRREPAGGPVAAVEVA